MTSTAITYQLTCGCTDWCNCTRCLAGTAHKAGELWMCDTHGRSSVAGQPAPPRPLVTVIEGDLVVVHSPEPFQFGPGHRMRAVHCLICHQMIGGQPATIIGVGALAGDPCTCSAVTSDMFLLHAAHLPMMPADLQAAIHRGLRCDNPDH